MDKKTSGNKFINLFKKNKSSGNYDLDDPNDLDIPTTPNNSYSSKTSGVLESLKNFQWDKFYDNLFSPTYRSLLHKLFIISLIGAGSYFSGKTIAIAIKSPLTYSKKRKSSPQLKSKAKKDHSGEIEQIRNANLFKAVDDAKTDGKPSPSEIKKKLSRDKACENATKRSSLPIKLSNTIVLQETSKSLASIKVRSRPALINYRQGDKIESLAEVKKIDRLKVILRNLNTGECEYIVSKSKQFKKTLTKKKYSVLSPHEGKKLLDLKTTDAIKSKGNQFSIKKSFRDEMLKDIGSILTQARAVKIKNPDGSLAFKMTEIVPGSIYSKLNIQNDDIITGVNGKKIQNLNEIMGLFGKIKDVDKLQITIKRNGIEQKLDYEFE